MMINRIVLVLYMLFVISLLSAAIFILILQPAVARYLNKKKSNATAVIALQQKKFIASDNAKNTKALLLLKQQHPHFYASIQSTKTLDQLLQILTRCAQQSGFSIVQAAPLAQLKRKNKSADAQIQLALSGNYADLFYFIRKLNALAWPFALSKLNILPPNQFKLIITARGFHA